MTIKDKLDAIQDYCRHKSSEEDDLCGSCKIKIVCDDCDGDFGNNYDLIEKAYQLINEGDSQNDVVNSPAHYNREGAIQSIDEMIYIFGKKTVADFCLCNVWKYRYRAADKNGAEDIAKSDWYMRKYMELTEGE